MCGIITIYNTAKNIDTSSVLDLYIDQKHRGNEGFGFSWLTRGGKVKTMRFTDEAQAFYALKGLKTQLLQFHHRHPTSTDNVAFQNHPICNNKSGFEIHKSEIHTEFNIDWNYFN